MLGGGPVYLFHGGAWYFGVSGAYSEGPGDDLFIGYGGPSVGYLFFPGTWLSILTACMAGSGGVSADGEQITGFSVLEPEAAVSFSILPGFRAAAGASCGLALPFAPMQGHGIQDLSGPSVFVSLRYGVPGPAPEPAREGVCCGSRRHHGPHLRGVLRLASVLPVCFPAL
jgi:hypothetical protein